MSRDNFLKSVIALIIIIILIMVFRPVKPVIEDYNCSDFNSYSEAKAIFDKYDSDIFKFDSDGDGLPCEALLNN